MIKAEPSRSQLEAHLAEQLSFLRTSCFLYDQGNVAEAKRLATTLRVLLHDTRTSASLLGQLGLLDQPFRNTSAVRFPGGVAAHAGLCVIAMARSMVYLPTLDDDKPVRVTPFASWWWQPVLRTSTLEFFSRRSLVLALANELGGAHVGASVSSALDRLLNRNSLGWTFVDDRGERPVGTAVVESASVRQIAHELLATFVPGYGMRHDFERLANAGVGIFGGVEAGPIGSENANRPPDFEQACRCGSALTAEECCYAVPTPSPS